MAAVLLRSVHTYTGGRVVVPRLSAAVHHPFDRRPSVRLPSHLFFIEASFVRPLVYCYGLNSSVVSPPGFEEASFFVFSRARIV